MQGKLDFEPGQAASGHKLTISGVLAEMRGGELAYDLIDRLHVLGIRIVVMPGYDAVPLAHGKAAAYPGKTGERGVTAGELAPDHGGRGYLPQIDPAVYARV